VRALSTDASLSTDLGPVKIPLSPARRLGRGLETNFTTIRDGPGRVDYTIC